MLSQPSVHVGAVKEIACVVLCMSHATIACSGDMSSASDSSGGTQSVTGGASNGGAKATGGRISAGGTSASSSTMAVGGAAAGATSTGSCGNVNCAHGTQYCHAVIGGYVGNPGTYTCIPLPAGCGSNPNCACLSGDSCGYNCMQSANGDLFTTCLVP